MVSNIRLQNFRSYNDSSFEFEERVNIIVGPNASGKTNLLESIYIACRGKSFKAKDEELIKINMPWARIDSFTDGGSLVVKIMLSQESTSKEFIVNSKPYKRFTKNMVQPVVIFEPNHLLLINGSPELRRGYLDDIIEMHDESFHNIRQDYRRTILQRNALLKSGKRNPQLIFVWDLRLSKLAEQIVTKRIELIELFNKNVGDIYSDVANRKSKVILTYKTPCNVKQYSSSLLKHLELNRDKDYERGFTGFGPHREDIEILLNNKPAITTASRGEVRTLLLALKIAELQILKDKEQAPILLLDDVFSELDGRRRSALTAHVKKYQTFITTTDADVVAKNFAKDTNLITF